MPVPSDPAPRALGPVYRGSLVAALVVLTAWWPPSTAARTAPQVSLWYRGTPAGTPKSDDLAMIRAIGFAGITWPDSFAAAAADVRRQAETVTLSVTVRAPKPPLTTAIALAPGDIIDVPVSAIPVSQLAALVWRAVAHGARTIAFDPGASSGPGVADDNGGTPPWVFPARTIARQLSVNAALFEQLAVPAIVALDPAPPGLEVLLFQTSREWVVIATNVSTTRARAVGAFPRAVPYAPWAGILDGSQMAMRDDPFGPRWSIDLEPGAARVYLASKR